MKAIIPLAGKGTRLRPHTHHTPKPLLKVGGRAVMSYILDDLRELGIEERIVVLPFVTRKVVAALYRRAALVLLPSEREGFGLPVVEAMACGTPVLCTDLPVLREVGGDAAEYCPLGEPSAWAARITALLRERESRPDAWEARRAAGLARSAAFTWTRYAETMQDIYERIAEGPVR